MAIQTGATLESYFETGDKPTQGQFADFIETALIGAPLNGGTSTGSPNTYDITVDSLLTSPTAGQVFTAVAHQTNSGAATASVNGAGYNLTKSGSTALAAGDVVLGAVVQFYFDGTRYQLMGTGSGGGGGGTVTSVAVSAQAPLQVGGSPITGSGTIDISFGTQAAGRFLAGPSAGVSANPAFRAVNSNDLPLATTASAGAVTISTTASAVAKSGTGAITADILGAMQFLSAEFAVSAGTTQTITHNLGTTTPSVAGYLTCVSADQGYTTGNTLGPISPNTQAVTNAYGYVSRTTDANNVQYRLGSNGVACFASLNMGTGNAVTLQNNCWTFRLLISAR